MIDPRRIDLGGVPAYFADPASELPFIAGLLFRVGWCDERLRTSGLTHLVEHMALPARHRPGVEFNGSVDNSSTHFWFSGDREASLGELRATLAALAHLPLERLESERRILMTEAAGRSAALVPLLMSLRFGTSGHGLSHYDELGLHWVSQDEVVAWAAHAFTRGNAAVYFAGPPPDDLALGLPDGARLTPPAPEPIEYVSYPSVFRGGPPGTVAVSMVGRRSYELMTALRVLEYRLRETLRYQHGVTYEVGWHYEPLTSDAAHVSVWADALDANLDRARNVLVTVIDELAFAGPSDADLERDLKAFEEAVEDPLSLPGALWRHAHDELLGKRADTAAEALERQREVTPTSAARALAEAAGSMLLCLPFEAAVPQGRFSAYPINSPHTVEGRRFKRRRGILRRATDGIEREITLGADGIQLETTEWVTAVRFADCQAMLQTDDSRGLWSADGFYIYVDPAIWRGGEELVRAIDAAIPQERVVPILGEDAVGGEDDRAKGEEALGAGRVDDAVKHLGLALERAPEDALGWSMLAYAHQGRFQFARALAAADRALELDPNLVYGHCARAHALAALGQTELATETARRAVQIDPADLYALSDYAAIAADSLQDTEGALRASSRAVELFPDDSAAWNALAVARTGAGDLDGAEVALRKAVEVEPNESMVHNNLGWHLLECGKPRDALECFDKARKLNPENQQALRNRIVTLLLLGRTREGTNAKRTQSELELKHYQELVTENPDDADARVLVVYRLLELDRPDEAREEITRLTAAARVAGRADRVYDAAAFSFALGDSTTGMASFTEARHLDEGSAEGEYYHAFFGLLTGDESAVREGAAALRARGHRFSNDADGYAALTENDPNEAIAHFDCTLERRPLRCCSHAWRAVAALRSGTVEDAGEQLERATILCAHGGSHCSSLHALTDELSGTAKQDAFSSTRSERIR